MTIKITNVNFCNNNRLQKMYQQKVETNKDEFKFKNQKKKYVDRYNESRSH